MRWWAITGYGLSVVAHIGFAAGIGSIRKDHPRPPTVIKAFDYSKKAKKTEQEKPKEDKPPPPPPKKSLEPPPAPKNTPPPPTNTSPTPVGHEAMAALPDFGISLGGGADGVGIAVPIGGTASAGPERVAAGGGGSQEKKVKGPAPKPSDAADACVEEATKPKSVDRVQPQYTDEARSANVEGVIKVEFRIDANGDVVDARVISGLGHGLDQAALAAAKRWKFTPATKCGKPVESRHVVGMRFQLGD